MILAQGRGLDWAVRTDEGSTSSSQTLLLLDYGLSFHFMPLNILPRPLFGGTIDWDILIFLKLKKIYHG